MGGSREIAAIIRGRYGLFVKEATDGLPWKMDGKTLPRLALVRPNHKRLRGRILIAWKFAVWFVRADLEGIT